MKSGQLALALLLVMSGGCAHTSEPETTSNNIQGHVLYGYGGTMMPQCIPVPGKVMVVFRTFQHFVAYENGCVAYREVAVNGSTVRIRLDGHVSTGSSETETPLTRPENGPHIVREMHGPEYRSHSYKGSDGKGAPMAYASFFDSKERLAFHCGPLYRSKALRGKPYGASHGCVRIPCAQMVALRFQFFDTETAVIITETPETLARDWLTQRVRTARQ